MGRLLQLPSKVPNIRRILLSTDRSTGKYTQAIEIYENIIENLPKDWDALYHISLCYYHIKNYNQSHEYIKKAEEVNSCTDVLKAFGKLLLRLNKINEAIEKLERAKDICPNDSEIL